MSSKHKDYEKQILGSIKIHQEIIDEFLITENLFIDPINKQFFNILKDIHSSGKKIDSLIVFDKIEKTELKGKIWYYEELETFYHSNVEYYIKKQKELIEYRNIDLLKLYISDWRREGKTPNEIVSLISDKISDLELQEKAHSKKIGEYLPDVLKDIEEAYTSHGKIKGVKSGFRKLDCLLNGFCESDFVVIGARPGTGKTSLTLNMAQNITKENIPALFISIEMTGKSLTTRALSSGANINLYSVRSGRLNKENFDNLTTEANTINNIPLYITDDIRLLSEIKSTIRWHKRNKGIKIVFIDYFTMIENDNQNLLPRIAYGKNSKGLKALTKETKLPIIVLSQLNRDAEDKPPTMKNLKETSELEDDADIILFLYRKEQKNKETDDNGCTDLMLVKNRNGATGNIKLYFKRETTTYKEVEQNYDDF